MTLSLPPLFCYHEKYLKKSNLCEEMYILMHNLRLQHFMAEESRQRKIESVSHTVCLIRRERRMHVVTHFCHFMQSRMPLLQWWYPKWVGFSNSLNKTKRTSHRYTQSSKIPIVLGSVKLSIIVEHHNFQQNYINKFLRVQYFIFILKSRWGKRGHNTMVINPED